MKKSFLPAFLLLFLALGMFSCQQGAKKTTKEYPMFWTWLDYRPGMNFDSICQVMNDIGMDGIMLNAPTPDDYRAAIPDRKSTRLNSSHWNKSRMPSSA